MFQLLEVAQFKHMSLPNLTALKAKKGGLGANPFIRDLKKKGGKQSNPSMKGSRKVKKTGKKVTVKETKKESKYDFKKAEKKLGVVR